MPEIEAERQCARPLTVDVQERVDPAWWNALVQASEQGTIYQTTYWADYVERYYRARPWYIIARSGTAVQGMLLLFNMGRFPDRDQRHPWQDRLKRPLNALARVLRWYSGPVVLDDAQRSAVMERLLRAVDELGAREKVWALDSGSLPARRGDGAAGVPMEAGFDVGEWGTFLINLRASTEALWANLKASSARSSITRAMKLGMRMVDATHASFEGYAQCEYEHGRAHDIAPWPRVGREALRDALAPAGAYRLFAAEYEGRAVAYTPVIVFNGVMHLIKPVQATRCAAEKIPAGDFLLWEAMRFGQAQGCSTFDLAGAAPEPRTAAERGIWFFKSKWGGEFVKYPVLRKSYRWGWRS